MSPLLLLFTTDSVANALGWVAAVLYLFSLVALVVRRKRPGAPEDGFLVYLPALVGAAAHLAAIVVRAGNLGRLPLGNLQESAIFLSFLIAISYFVAAARFRYPAVEALLLCLALAFLSLSFVLPESAQGTSSPALHSRWFVFHTLLSFIGLAALFGACVVSVLYLLEEMQLKSKRPGAMLRFLPSLVSCDRTALRLLLFGFPLFTLGIVSGLFWSREAGHFAWGPKEVWAVTAWAMYAALVFVRLARGWRGRRAAMLSVTAAAAALGAFFGIRL